METTDESLADYFSQYGEITDASVIREKVTNNSRGFGFVTFASSDAVRATLNQNHMVDNKTVGDISKIKPPNMHEQFIGAEWHCDL